MRCHQCGAALGAGTACGRCPGPPAAGPAHPYAAAYAPAYAPPAAPAPYAAPPAPYAAAPPAAAPARVATAPAPYAYVPPAYYLDATPPAPAGPPLARRAGWTTFAAIGVGALLQWALGLLLAGRTVEQEALVRYGIVTVLLVYATVGYLVVRRVAADAHPLRWRGPWGVVPSAAFGFAVGGSAGWLLLRALRGLGVEGGDRPTALLVSERTLPYIAVAFLIACVAAPLVEEALFRGLLLESWLGHGEAVALLGSAALFAAWHLAPAQLPYYTIAGTLLGLLYLRHGLSCSIAAHVAFNGTVVVAAVLYAFAPGPVVTVAESGLTLRAPSGWHTVPGAPDGYLYGPSDAVIAVHSLSTDRRVPARELVARVEEGRVPGLAALRVRTDTVHTVDLPAGEAARVTAVSGGREVYVVLLPGEDRLHVVLLRGAGSARARADFDRVLDSVVIP